jgi:hypothetical protein
VLRALLAALGRRGIDGAKANPWYFAAPDEYRARLESHGFDVTSMTLVPRPTSLPGRLGDWLDTFGESFLASVPRDQHEDFKREIEAELAPTMLIGGIWIVDYVRLRFAANLPGRAS